MKRMLRVAILFALSLVVVAGGLLAGCGSGQAALEMPDIEMFQYLKGTTVDFNDATLNQMAEGGGEAGFKFGIMKSIYPGIFEDNKDAVAQMMFPPPYKILQASDDPNVTTYAMLTSGDKQVVEGTIFALKLTAAEQDVVMTAVAGFFDRVEIDMADAKTPDQTSAYAILQGVGGTAAANWAADVADGMDYADRFFVHLVKQYVTAFPAAFAPFWAALGYDPPPASPSNAEIEMVARIAGENSFKNGVAGAMYPTQQEETAQDMYGKSYADLNVALGETSYVDAAVYQDLPSAFGTGAAADAIRAAIRDSMTANLQAYYGLSADNYTALRGVEKVLVDQAIGSQLDAKDACGNYTKPLGFGPHLERDYVDFFAFPGAVLNWGAEMAPAKDLDQNMAYLALNSGVSKTAADSWIEDYEAGVHYRQAFYRWLAKEAVSEMAAAAILIQMSVVEFYIKITNPNDYPISVDSMNINCQVEASGEMIDAAKAAIGDKVWVPANGEVIFRVLTPVKTLDVVTWAVLAGKDANTARALAANVWNQVQAGTADWEVAIEAQVSSETETKTETYTLEWSAS